LRASSNDALPNARAQDITSSSGLAVIAASAPLLGLSAFATRGVAFGAGGLKWLSYGWERGLWACTYGSLGVLACARPLRFFSENYPALVSNNFAEPLDSTCRVTFALATACPLGAVIGERLGGRFGRSMMVPLIVGAVVAAYRSSSDHKLCSLAAVPFSVVPFLLLASSPVYTASWELLGVCTWVACGVVPRVLEATSARHSSTKNAIHPAYRIAYEQISMTMASALLFRYLLRRRPMCQF